MSDTEMSLVISCPESRLLDLIFAPGARQRLQSTYRIIECSEMEIGDLPAQILAQARYIIGQPPLSAETPPRLATAGRRLRLREEEGREEIQAATAVAPSPAIRPSRPP